MQSNGVPELNTTEVEIEIKEIKDETIKAKIFLIENAFIELSLEKSLIRSENEIKKEIPNFLALSLKLENLNDKFRCCSFSLDEFYEELVSFKKLYQNTNKLIREEIIESLHNNQITIAQFLQINYILGKIPKFISNCEAAQKITSKESYVSELKEYYEFHHPLDIYKKDLSEISVNDICTQIALLTKQYNNLFLINQIHDMLKDDSQLHKIYMLGIMLEIIQHSHPVKEVRIFSKWERVDKSIIIIAMIMCEILQKVPSEGILDTINPLFSLILKITDPDFTWKQHKSQLHLLSTELRDQIIKYIQPFDIDQQRLFSPDPMRANLLQDLANKKAQYFSELFSAAFNSTPRDDGYLLELLIIRLIAVDYLSKKLQTQNSLTSEGLRSEMKQTFGSKITDKMYESRGRFKPSHIVTVINQSNLPELKQPPKMYSYPDLQFFNQLNTQSKKTADNESEYSYSRSC